MTVYMICYAAGMLFSRISLYALSGIVLIFAALVLFAQDMRGPGLPVRLRALFSLSFVGGQGLACLKLSRLQTDWELMTWAVLFLAYAAFWLAVEWLRLRNGPAVRGAAPGRLNGVRRGRLFLSIVIITGISLCAFLLEAFLLGYVPLLVRGVPHAYSYFHISGVHYFTVSCVLVPAFAAVWTAAEPGAPLRERNIVRFCIFLSFLIPVLCVSRSQMILAAMFAGITLLITGRNRVPAAAGAACAAALLVLYVILTVARSHSVEYLNGIFEMKRNYPIFISQVDEMLHENADMQHKAGLRPKIIRTAEPGCCEWCASLAGEYDYGTSVTVTATANEGYTFTNWTLNGTEVSTEASYDFTVTGATELVANFTLNSYTVSIAPNPIEGGTVAFASKEGGKELTYDFEDGWQGWTTFQGNTTSPNSWMHNTAYPTSNNDFTTGYGYNNSDGFMLSESYISGTSSGAGQAVTPDNYLVSPQVRLGGSISFYAGARNTSYCAEKFSVMVSTTDNTNAASFTTVGTWTLSLSEAGYNSTPYTVDLSAYSGMGYIAIRHFDCYDQWFLAVDNITIVEGTIDDGSASGTFNYGTSCTVTATPNANYHFVNWTENGATVSTEASYTFTVTSGRDLVANFSAQQPSLVGDVNEDGVISIDDVSVLLSHVLGNISLTGQVLINADVNGDGVISIDDVSTLLYMSMNK